LAENDIFPVKPESFWLAIKGRGKLLEEDARYKFQRETIMSLEEVLDMMP